MTVIEREPASPFVVRVLPAQRTLTVVLSSVMTTQPSAFDRASARCISTTLARIVAHTTRAHFEELSAVQVGIADVRRVLAQPGLVPNGVYFALGGRSNPDYYAGMAERLAAIFPDFTIETFPERHHFDPPHRVEPERLANSLLALWQRAE